MKSIPIETKKTALKTSRKDVISARAWWPYSDSESTSPARKAPRAAERPAQEVASAEPSTRKRTATTKISFCRVPARAPMKRGITKRATTSSTAAVSTVFPVWRRIGIGPPDPPWAKADMESSIGTTARS